MSHKSDIEIAREANKKPIQEIGEKLGIPTEFFSAKVRTKSCLGHNVIGQFQRSLCRDDRVTTVCDVRKWSTVDECRVVFQCLH